VVLNSSDSENPVVLLLLELSSDKNEAFCPAFWLVEPAMNWLEVDPPPNWLEVVVVESLSEKVSFSDVFWLD
jgi:hypothetical protein